MVEPISPNDVSQAIPDEVIEIFNERIKNNWLHGRAVLNQYDTAMAISERLDISVDEVFNQGYTEIEDIYRAAGWNVDYKTPAYDDVPFSPHFVFTKPTYR